LKKGLEKGIEKGRTETQNEIVKKMLKKGYNEDTIAELTNLTLEEISKIKISL
jgi:predicted transposase/invertase (TIGR01784 family)